jgi:Uma2 family endonuclease
MYVKDAAGTYLVGPRFVTMSGSAIVLPRPQEIAVAGSPDGLPTMYDLPSEDPEEPGLPDEFHLWQPRLLDDTFCPTTYPRNQVFAATDMNLYYDATHPNWYKRPDWFGVVGVSQFYDQRDLRLSYVIWQEQISPMVIVELLSPGTEGEDLGTSRRDPVLPPSKWEVYESILGVPYYVSYDRYSNRLRVFQRRNSRLVAVDALDQRVWMPELGLGLGLWLGTYNFHHGYWLRWFDNTGQWIPTPLERESALLIEARQQVEQEGQRAEQEHQRAEQERQRAEQERQRAEQERQRAEQLLAQMRALGIEPDLG